MRILIVCYVSPPEPAPGGVMARELAEDLAVAGHEVTLVTSFPNHPDGVLYPGWKRRWRYIEQRKPYRLVRTWHLFSRSKRVVSRSLFYASFALTSFLNALFLGRFDVIYCDSTPIFGPLACWLIAVAKRAALVYGILDMYPEAIVDAGLLRPGLVSRLLLRADCFVCRRASRNLVISEGLRRRLLDRGLPELRIGVLPIWVDAGEIEPGPRLNAWRRENQIPDDSFVVLYAGTIGLVSGAQIMVDVAERLADDREILLLFVGQGLAKAEAERTAKERGLRNMRFLDFQPRERLAEVQATAGVSLVTLLPGAGRNSVPSKVLAYMSAARPIVASVDLDSDTARWIEEAQCGIVVPAQDVAGVAAAIRRLRTEPETARTMGEKGREVLLTKYNRSCATKAYEALFREVVEERRADSG